MRGKQVTKNVALSGPGNGWGLGSNAASEALGKLKEVELVGGTCVTRHAGCCLDFSRLMVGVPRVDGELILRSAVFLVWGWAGRGAGSSQIMSWHRAAVTWVSRCLHRA
jgi:hypothetical protein